MTLKTLTPGKYLVPALILAGLALAQPAGRIISIEAPGGRRTGSPRTGPLEYAGNVKGSVQELVITAPKATLSAPQGQDLGESEGKRTASFEGSVQVTRGRLTATGPSLVYQESTGVGTLKGPTRAVQKPEKAGDDEVIITAAQASFDVDADTSTSTGDVKLVSGKQSGQSDKLVFEEKRELAVLTDASKVDLVREPKDAGDKRLTIAAREARMLTGKKLLIANGGVTLVSGDTTTTGTELYYDDNKDIAYVFGRPALSLNKKDNSRVTGSALTQNTRNNQVRIGGSNFQIPRADFKLTGEK